MAATKHKEASPPVGSPEDVKLFKKASKEWLKENASTPEKAREALIRLGIYTRSGKLHKNYGG